MVYLYSRCWRRLWRVPWTARRSNQSILKEITPGISLEGMMLSLKLQYFGHLMWRVDSLEKTLMLRGIGGQEEKGTTEDEMAGWHHWLDGRESEWTLGVGAGQGDLACCDSWGHKESDMTEWLNWTELIQQEIPCGSDGEESSCNAGDPGSIPELGRSHWGGNGNPLRYSWMDSFMDRGLWQATAHGASKTGTLLSD